MHRGRNETYQQDRACHSRKRHNPLHRAGKPLDRRPESPDAHHVCDAASHHEHGEAFEPPVELQVRAPPDQVEKRQRNREVGGRDDSIGETLEIARHCASSLGWMDSRATTITPFRSDLYLIRNRRTNTTARMATTQDRRTCEPDLARFVQ